MSYTLNYIQENLKNQIIVQASNGSVYYKDHELHAENETFHFIYKFQAENIGWYQRNPKTEIDYFLGEYAAPSIKLNDLNIKNEELWDKILYQELDEINELEELIEK